MDSFLVIGWSIIIPLDLVYNVMKLNKQTVLIVDDEPDILETVDFALRQNNYNVVSCMDGVMALKLYQQHKPDLVILDVMMPDLNGFEVCARIREFDNRTPILMLTAKNAEMDVVEGLNLGAHDYIPKPVRLRELMARVKSHLKHSEITYENSSSKQVSEASKLIDLGSLVIDCENFTIAIHGKEVELTQREFELLSKLASTPNRVFSREQLLEEVWGWSFIGESRTIDVHVRYLREKIEEDPANPKILKTIRGVGYKLIPTNC